MSFSLDILPEQQVVKATVKGQLSMNLRQRLLSGALFALKANRFTSLLIDVTRSTFAPSESMTDAFQVITFMRSLGFSPDIHIAFLQQGDDPRRRFFENAAQADGFLLKYFKEPGEALRWLTGL